MKLVKQKNLKEENNNHNVVKNYVLSREFIDTLISRSWLKHICKQHTVLSPIITSNAKQNIPSAIINCINSYCYALTEILTNIEKIQKTIKGDYYTSIWINNSHIISIMDLDKLNIDDYYNKYISRLLSLLDIEIHQLPEYVLDILTVYSIINIVSCVDTYDCLYSLNEFITLDDSFQNKHFKFSYKFIPLFNKNIGMGYNITVGYSIDLKDYILILGGGGDGHEFEYNYEQMIKFFNLDTDAKRKRIKYKNIKKLTIEKIYEFMKTYISEISELTNYSII
jgi:hypothetical protein